MPLDVESKETSQVSSKVKRYLRCRMNQNPLAILENQVCSFAPKVYNLPTSVATTVEVAPILDPSRPSVLAASTAFVWFCVVGLAVWSLPKRGKVE